MPRRRTRRVEAHEHLAPRRQVARGGLHLPLHVYRRLDRAWPREAAAAARTVGGRPRGGPPVRRARVGGARPRALLLVAEVVQRRIHREDDVGPAREHRLRGGGGGGLGQGCETKVAEEAEAEVAAEEEEMAAEEGAAVREAAAAEEEPASS